MRRVLATLARRRRASPSSWRYLGERGAPLFLIYIWITLANGFRFGQRYLMLALALSASVGFGVVLLVRRVLVAAPLRGRPRHGSSASSR